MLMPEVVTLGETMVGFTPADGAPLATARTFQRFVGGAESNVAVGVVKLGHTAGWISRVGSDVFGRIILDELQGLGVDTTHVAVSKTEPTGIYFKDRSHVAERTVVYYRRGSAMSRMRPEELDPSYIAAAKVLHITGITLALSESSRRTAHRAIELAKEHGVLVSFDPNYRPALWPEAQARAAYRGVMPFADIVITTEEETSLLASGLERGGLEEMLGALAQLGPRAVYIKQGAAGAAYSVNGEVGRVSGVRVSQVVDTVGAGDAFAAGVLVGHLESLRPGLIVRLANAMGASAVTALGDTDGVPGRVGINTLLMEAYGEELPDLE